MNATRRAALALFFLAALPAGPLSAAETGTVNGHVVVSPAAPVQRLGEPNERPFRGRLAILDGNGAAVAQVESDDTGTFHIRLPAGRYSLRPEPFSKIGRISGGEFVVQAGHETKVRAIYDTGVR